MEYELRIIVEKVAVSKQEVVKRDTLKIYDIQRPESIVDSLINARHKRKKKMQWTWQGAYYVLQIRAMMASGDWEHNCQATVLLALKAVAS